jgi:hypothetical protein
VEADFQGGGDPRWRLRGQLQVQAIEQQLLVGLRLGVPYHPATLLALLMYGRLG